MSLSLSFTNLYDYDLAQPGITLPVQLISGQLSADVNAKLDTGATHCIFQRFIGEELGFTIENGERREFSTATGMFVAYEHAVTLTTLGMSWEVLVCFAKDHSFVRNVLGRSGFLNRVLFGLNDYAGRLYLGNLADVE
jgi:hypothetical protein